MITNKELVKRVLPKTESKIKRSQANAVFTGFSMNLVSRDSYYYNGNEEFKKDFSKDMVIYQVYDLPLLSKGNNAPLFSLDLPTAVANKYIAPFLITNEVYAKEDGVTYLKSSKFIPWNKMTIIKNYNYTYIIIDGISEDEIGSIKCVSINCRIKYRLGASLTNNIDIGLMVKEDGSITYDYKECAYAIVLNRQGNTNTIAKGDFFSMVNQVEENFKDEDREEYTESDTKKYVDNYSILGSPGSYIYFNSDYLVPVSNVLVIADIVEKGVTIHNVIIEPDIISNPYDNLFLFTETDKYDINKLSVNEVIVFFDTRGYESLSHSMKYIPYNNRIKLIADILYNASLEESNPNMDMIENIFKNGFDINISDYVDETGSIDYNALYSTIDKYDNRIFVDEKYKVSDFHGRYINSFTLTGKELKEKVNNVNEVTLNRSYWRDDEFPYQINGFNYVMIFKNNQLYNFHKTILFKNNQFSFGLDIDSTADDDKFEFILISRCKDNIHKLETNLLDIQLKDNGDSIILRTSPKYNLKLSKIYENSPKNNTILYEEFLNNPDTPFSYFSDRNYDESTYVIDILLGYDCISEYDMDGFQKGSLYKLDLTKLPEGYRDRFKDMYLNPSNPCHLTIVPKEQFAYYNYLYNVDNFNSIMDNDTGELVVREKDVACKLPSNMKYCREENQFFVFVNGKRVDPNSLMIAAPDVDNPYDELVLYMAQPFSASDNIDIFYLPFKMYEDDTMVKNAETGQTNILLFNSSYQTINKDNTMIFADGSKICYDEIEYKGKSIVKIYNEDHYRNIRCTYIVGVNDAIEFSQESDSWMNSLNDLEWKFIYRLFNDIISDPSWVNNKDNTIPNTETSFEDTLYPRLGIIVQAYKDYYSAYTISASDIIEYTGEEILYNYKGDPGTEPVPVMIHNAKESIHIPLR